MMQWLERLMDVAEKKTTRVRDITLTLGTIAALAGSVKQYYDVQTEVAKAPPSLERFTIEANNAITRNTEELRRAIDRVEEALRRLDDRTRAAEINIAKLTHEVQSMEKRIK